MMPRIPGRVGSAFVVALVVLLRAAPPCLAASAVFVVSDREIVAVTGDYVPVANDALNKTQGLHTHRCLPL